MVRQMQEVVMTVGAPAARRGLWTPTLCDLCAEAKPGAKVGRCWRFQRIVVDQWAAEGLRRRPGK